MNLYEFSCKEHWLTDLQRERLSTVEDAAFFELLLRQCPVPESILLETLSSIFNFSIKTLAGLSPDPMLLSQYDAVWMKTHALMPLFYTGRSLVVAAHNPFHPELAHFKKQGHPLEIWQVNRYDLQQALSPTMGVDPLLASSLEAALERRASDMVVHSTQTGCDITCRVQGTLLPIRSLHSADTKRLIQLLKLEAHLDVGETAAPQEGRLEYRLQGQVYEGRLSLIPTLYGEDAVIRFFYSDQPVQSLSELGFLEESLQAIQQMISQKSGLILVTGPTGSGKTTTLYALLRELSQDRRKSIISLEDPIESQLPGIRQSQINPDKDYSYADGLKSLLRQDPDVMMIGEIRDAKTAQLVLEAAYTGHLVLSTLHTSSVMASLLRCLSFGCDPFMLRYALKGIISQTLAPKKCSACNTQGCPDCDFTGYNGRTLLAEWLRLDEPLTATTDPAQWIEQGHFYAYNADHHSKQQLGWL